MQCTRLAKRGRFLLLTRLDEQRGSDEVRHVLCCEDLLRHLRLPPSLKGCPGRPPHKWEANGAHDRVHLDSVSSAAQRQKLISH